MISGFLADIVKLTAQEWEKADITVREQLQAAYKREMVDFLAAQVKYDQMLTSEQREEIKKAKKDMAESKEKRVLKKVICVCVFGRGNTYVCKSCASIKVYRIFFSTMK
jgi:hypothetical protein